MPLASKASLRHVCARAGITRAQLARESAVSFFRIQELEMGRKAPSQAEYLAIVEALRRMGVPLDPQAIHGLFGADPEQARQALRRQVRLALERLLPFISLRQLEALLDLSHGYLSRLLHCEQAAQRGKAVIGTPSATLVCTLALLAQDPPTRLQELRQFWNSVSPQDSAGQEPTARKSP